MAFMTSSLHHGGNNWKHLRVVLIHRNDLRASGILIVDYDSIPNLMLL
jgi:hypothetical protein